jgi:hypothetical protein
MSAGRIRHEVAAPGEQGSQAYDFDSNTLIKAGAILTELAESDIPLSGDLSMGKTGADPNDAAHLEPAEHSC